MWNTKIIKCRVRFLCSHLGIQKRQMPTCCTNCRTKYSVLNPEEGCSNCALSFCRRCLPYRAILPQLANKPVTVCSQCFEKLNGETLKRQDKNGTQITKIAIGDVNRPNSSGSDNVRSSNWWGDGLPPPSLRQSVGRKLPPTRVLHGNVLNHAKQVERSEKDAIDLEERWKKSRQDDVPSEPLTLAQIEERLAALRGCDVDLIRRPRCIFESSASSLPTVDSPQDLIKMAKERIEIEERHNPVNELEQRHKALREDNRECPSSSERQEQTMCPEGPHDSQNDPRLSTVSSATAFSEATANELREIDRLLEDAQKRVNASQAEEKNLEREMKEVVAATRQKSLDIEKVSNELGHFWDKQLDKVELSDSDDGSIDDETVKKIILEAEQATEDFSDDSRVSDAGSKASTNTTSSSAPQPFSPKKPGLFSRIFRS